MVRSGALSSDTLSGDTLSGDTLSGDTLSGDTLSDDMLPDLVCLLSTFSRVTIPKITKIRLGVWGLIQGVPFMAAAFYTNFLKPHAIFLRRRTFFCQSRILRL